MAQVIAEKENLRLPKENLMLFDLRRKQLLSPHMTASEAGVYDGSSLMLV
jgi:hypothetical protein